MFLAHCMVPGIWESLNKCVWNKLALNYVQRRHKDAKSRHRNVGVVSERYDQNETRPGKAGIAPCLNKLWVLSLSGDLSVLLRSQTFSLGKCSYLPVAETAVHSKPASSSSQMYC